MWERGRLVPTREYDVAASLGSIHVIDRIDAARAPTPNRDDGPVTSGPAAAPSGAVAPTLTDVLMRRTIARPLPSVLCATAGGALVAVAIAWPRWTEQPMGATWAPLTAVWDPRIGPGSIAAVLVAVAVIAVGPALGRRLSWPALLLWTWSAATAWTVALASVDGRDGIGDQFSRRGFFLHDAMRVSSWHDVFPGFIDRIPVGVEDNWAVHVSSHPPGALLAFIGFDRVGLSDTFWLGLTVLALGTTATVACCIAVRALAGEEWARRATPWLILAPAAVWIGVSPDALFAAVAAWALTLLALAATGRRNAAGYAVASGLAFGCCLYLSYGFVLLAPLALAVLIAARRWQPIPWVLAGIAIVIAAVTVAGFAWWEAYPVLVDRYQVSRARIRPYDYWVWANVAGWTFTTGLAVWAALPAGVRALRSSAGRRRPGERAIAVLVAGALISVLAATISGMSKSEVERIWLPFTWWALALAALLPGRAQRPLLAAQAAGALAIQHLVVTEW
jgi:methylthioxylose transferase